MEEQEVVEKVDLNKRDNKEDVKEGNEEGEEIIERYHEYHVENYGGEDEDGEQAKILEGKAKKRQVFEEDLKEENIQG